MGDGAAWEGLGRVMADFHLACVYKQEYKIALGWVISEMLDRDKMLVIQVITALPSCSTEWEPDRRVEATCRLLLTRLLPQLGFIVGDEYVLEGLVRLIPRDRAVRIIREVNQVL